jgi:heptose-I-phosphate ethanolaminephosphotransferase
MKENLRKIVRWLKKVAVVVTRPVWENFLFITFMFAVWGITVWREVQYEGDVWPHISELFLDLYLICLILHILPKKEARAVRTVLYVLGYALAFFEEFLSERFMMLFTPTTLRLWLETTGEESKEFFKAYFTGEPLWRTLKMFLPLLVLNVALILITWQKSFWQLKAVRSLKRSLLPSIARYVVMAFLLLCLLPWGQEKSKMITFFNQKTSQTAEKVRWQTFYTPFYRLVYSYRMLQLADKALVSLKHQMHHLEIDTCTFRCPQIVLVIGESYNKYHSQLYGYPLPTTPRQLEMAHQGSLIAFNDVVTTWNLTSNVFKNMFSTHSIDQPGTWCDGVLFPALFRKAGYRVAFLTNQFQNVNRQSGVDFNGSFFFNDPEVDSLCFDFRNTMIYRFDRAFIREYEKYVPATNNLVIFHLYGQHQKYDYRFTPRDVYFTPDSLAGRRNLAAWMKQTVADYDNATRYNDDVFARICDYFKDRDAIVIYLSDHGEEVFDHSLTFGRTPADPITPLIAHYEFEVPMEMWFSPQFRKKHHRVVKAARAAVNRPYMSDELPHLLMGLAGIKCRYYDKYRDLLSDSFNVARPRLLKGKYDYDSLISGSRFEREKNNLKTQKPFWTPSSKRKHRK